MRHPPDPDRSTLRDAFGHHGWATIRIIAACAALRPQELDTTVPGTFGSIIETLRHLVSADRSYVSVLSDGRIAAVETGTLGIDELRSVTEASNSAWASLLSGEVDANRVLVRERDDGTETRAPASIRLAQALHHGTDHRSQLCTALTTLGIEPPVIDAWEYAWLNGRLIDTRRS